MMTEVNQLIINSVWKIKHKNIFYIYKNLCSGSIWLWGTSMVQNYLQHLLKPVFKRKAFSFQRNPKMPNNLLLSPRWKEVFTAPGSNKRHIINGDIADVCM